MPAFRRYSIIGSGVAGIAAAQSIRETDPSGEITLLTEDPHGYYSRPGLAYYLTGELGEDAIYPMQKKELKSLHLRWLQKQVTGLNAEAHTLTLFDRSVLAYDRLLIASGSQAAPLNLPGCHLQGVYKLDDFKDAKAILQHIRRSRTAVVVGGGITALELAEALNAQGLQVHYLLRGSRYWSNVLDETESQIVESRLEEDGIQLHFNTEIGEIVGKNGKVSAVTTKTGQIISCEMVAYAIGVLPRVDLARAAQLNVDRGILADETLRTSHPDIFAAGDVAQVYDPYSGKSGLDTLWTTARVQGQVAGFNMAGRQTRYLKSVPLNITRLAGLTTTIIGRVGQGADPSLTGINRGDSETWRARPEAMVAETRDDTNRVRLLVGLNRLIGAVVMGDQTLSHPLQELINQQADITPIRDVLLRSQRVSEIIKAFWKQWRSPHA